MRWSPCNTCVSTDRSLRVYYKSPVWMPRLPERVLSIMAYTGRLRPKGVSFFRLQVYERVGILLVVVYEGRKSVI